MLEVSKKRKSKAKASPRWMITFADLMALLFALFVMLLSFSEINSDSFRRNAGPINMAFNTVPIIPTTVSRPVAYATILPVRKTENAEKPPRDLRQDWKAELLRLLQQLLEREIDRKRVLLIEKDHAIVIRFPETTAFPSGGSRLAGDFTPVLDKIAGLLVMVKGQVFVSGHTDDRPIATAKYRSNWDLSTARAASVVHYLLSAEDIDPSRITVQGFADGRPIAPNDTPQNRAKNRRVEIAVEVPDASLLPASSLLSGP
jgi:chemotaxis protein MotB